MLRGPRSCCISAEMPKKCRESRTLLSLGVQTFKTMCVVFSVALAGGCNAPDRPVSNISAPKADDTEKPSSSARLRHVVIDIPKLAFARQTSVNSALGAPKKVKRDSNIADWREGAVTSVLYSRAECTFLEGRLVSITYTFKIRPKSAEDVLEYSGLPREASALDNANPGHLPFRAFYAPNPAYRNPVRCCGLLLQWVSIPEDRSEVWVNFANINEHYADWPEQIRSAWLRAGASPL